MQDQALSLRNAKAIGTETDFDSQKLMTRSNKVSDQKAHLTRRTAEAQSWDFEYLDDG